MIKLASPRLVSLGALAALAALGTLGAPTAASAGCSFPKYCGVQQPGKGSLIDWKHVKMIDPSLLAKKPGTGSPGGYGPSKPHGGWGYGAAALGGMAVGMIAAGAGGGYGGGGYAYGDCFLARRQAIDEFGNVYVKRVRVCQ